VAKKLHVRPQPEKSWGQPRSVLPMIPSCSPRRSFAPHEPLLLPIRGPLKSPVFYVLPLLPKVLPTAPRGRNTRWLC
jgi:hypothetical protein